MNTTETDTEIHIPTLLTEFGLNEKFDRIILNLSKNLDVDKNSDLKQLIDMTVKALDALTDYAASEQGDLRILIEGWIETQSIRATFIPNAETNKQSEVKR